jgi:hypothetical protein
MSRYRSQVTEVINRNIVASLALKQGFNVFLPVYDGGVDFILYHEDDQDIRKVQLKSRWTIDKKYEGRDIWIAFQINGDWYLMRHDEMVRSAGPSVLESQSWIKDGNYSLGQPSKAVIRQCERYRFPSIVTVAAKAAEEESAISALPRGPSIR